MGDGMDIDLVSGEFWGRNPQAELRWLRENRPVFWDERNEIWGIARYDHLKEIATRPTVFSNAGGIRPDSGPIPMMIDMDDPAHLRRRMLVNKGFTPQRVRDREPRIRQIVNGLIDRFCERGSCDFVLEFAAWLPLVVIGDSLGAEATDHPDLLRWSDDLMRGQGSSDETLVLKMMEAFAGYEAYISGVIAKRRQQATEDLMSVLVHAEVDGESLADDELVHESLLLLIGGDETSRHVITGGLYQLLSNRSQWEQLQADRSLIPGAVEEMLRWVSPIKNMARTATEDVEFHGETIRAGQKLLLLYPSANRDDAVFADPDTFDVTRTPNEHVAFGFGPHFCLGAALARLELTVTLDVLLDRLGDLELAVPEEPEFRPANFVTGYEHMPLVFGPSAPVGAAAGAPA